MIKIVKPVQVAVNFMPINLDILMDKYILKASDAGKTARKL